MSSLLTVNNLQVQFATRKTFATAVDDFSLTINAGECVGLVGESGCGKTTTGLAIMRLLPGNGRIASATSCSTVSIWRRSARRRCRANVVAPWRSFPRTQ